MANFSLLAKLGLDSKGFQTGIDKAKGSVNKFGRSITKISSRLAKMGLAGASAAFVLFSRSALQSANAVDRAADRLGVTTDEFQDFTNAAKAADIETRAAEMGLQRFTRRLGEAQQGGGELKDTLEKYNIAIRNSDGSARTASAVLDDLANAIKGAESPAEQLRIAFKAFDSEGADLVRILKDGEEGFKNFTKTGNEEFGKFEAGTVEALSRADKAIRAFKSQATIKVGELIAMEGEGAAFKTLGLQFSKVASEFGTQLLSQILKVAVVMPKAIEAAAKGALSKNTTFLKEMQEFYKPSNNLLQGLADFNNEFYDKQIEKQKTKLEKARKDFENNNDSGGNLFDDLPPSGGSGSEGENEREKKDREDAFIAAKELEALELKAAGKHAQAEALEKQIALTKKAMSIADEYGISLMKAANIVKGIEDNAPGGGTDEARKKKLEGLEEKIKDMKLEALRAQAKGDKKSEESLNNRVRLAEKIVSIMKEFGVSQEEATRLAQDKKQPKPEDTRGDFAQGLEGGALLKTANKAGKDDNIRFERMGDGSFQQFVDGKKGEKFTEEQMQKGLENKIEKDSTDETLKSIEKTLQGKFVNE